MTSFLPSLPASIKSATTCSAPSATSFLPVAKKNLATPPSITTCDVSAAGAETGEAAASEAAAGSFSCSSKTAEVGITGADVSTADTAPSSGSEASAADAAVSVGACPPPVLQLLNANRAASAAIPRIIHLPKPPFLAAAVAPATAAVPAAVAEPKLPASPDKLPNSPLRLPIPNAESMSLLSTCDSQPCCWPSNPKIWLPCKLLSFALPRNTDNTNGSDNANSEPDAALDTPLSCEIRSATFAALPPNSSGSSFLPVSSSPPTPSAEEAFATAPSNMLPDVPVSKSSTPDALDGLAPMCFNKPATTAGSASPAAFVLLSAGSPEEARKPPNTSPS